MYAKQIKLIGEALGMGMLILDSQASAKAASESLGMCIRTVIPALFPFFLLSGLITGSLGGGKWAAKLFHSGKGCGVIILTGLLAGYPVGAKVAAEAVRDERITQAQGNRLLSFCSQAGPSFLFGMVAAQFDRMRYAWLLWLIQILSAASVAWLLPEDTAVSSRADPTAAQTDPMRSALSAMSSVCGWVIVFGVIISFLKRWILWLLPESAQILLCGLLELTNGCLMLREISDVSLRFLTAAILLNFGGVCVLMQTASVASNLNIRSYLRGKFLQTIFSILYAQVFMGNIIAILPIITAFSLKYSLRIRKRYSIPGINGV